MFASWQESSDKLRQCVGKQRQYSANKVPCSQGQGLLSGCIWLWELNCKEGRMPKNWWLQIVELEKTPESLLDSKDIRSVNVKGNQLWILVGRTDTEAQAPVFWSSEANSQLIEKFPDARKDWGQKEKNVSENDMAGWHHGYNGHELEQTLGDGEGHGGLACCSPWGHKALGTTRNWTTTTGYMPFPKLQRVLEE